MTRLGASILLLIVLAVAGFASMLRFGDGSAGKAECPTVRGERSRGTCPEHVLRQAQGERVGGGRASFALTVPVAGYPRHALIDSWGDAREGGVRAHEGLDIVAPAGTPVLAAASGRVEKLFQSGRGGTTLYQRSADGRWMFYYAHLSAYMPGVREGMNVRAGQPIARVGDTGDAGAGNHHLHFGISRMPRDARWWQGEAVNPYPLLARGPATR